MFRVRSTRVLSGRKNGLPLSLSLARSVLLHTYELIVPTNGHRPSDRCSSKPASFVILSLLRALFFFALPPCLVMMIEGRRHT